MEEVYPQVRHFTATPGFCYVTAFGAQRQHIPLVLFREYSLFLFVLIFEKSSTFPNGKSPCNFALTPIVCCQFFRGVGQVVIGWSGGVSYSSSSSKITC